jgi:hypothetical protein
MGRKASADVSYLPRGKQALALTPFVLAAALAVVAAALGGLWPNIYISLTSVAVLFAGTLILWRPGELPLPLLMFGMAWLQASIAVFVSNWHGIGLQYFSKYRGEMELATVLSLIGLFVMALAMRAAARRTTIEAGRRARAAVLRTPMKFWFRSYAAAAAVSFVVLKFAWISGGFAQLLIAIANLKWAFFLMLAYAAILRRATTSWYFVLPFGFELALSFGGFFSDFKTVFLFSWLAFIAAGVRPTPRLTAALAVLGVAIVVSGAAWSEIKDEYRAFVSGGTRAQVVMVDYDTRVLKLASLIGKLDSGRLSDGFDKLFRRFSYVEMFSIVLDYVPTVQPYQDGALTADAIMRPFMPRLLFADKSIVDDSARTTKFTGVIKADANTSISLGYIAEFYIDFGVPLMFVALFALGMFYGAIFRWLVTSPMFSGPLGMGLASAVLMQVATLDNSFTKVFGGVMALLLACWVIGRYGVERFFPWVRETA